MEYNTLRNQADRFSALGFGCCPMGLHGWGSDVNEKELFQAVEIALDHGVTLFDTADVYGLGTSERILGRSLGSRRTEARIASKFGVRIDESGNTFYDNSPGWIDTALEASLKRLGTDYIDLYQVHYPDGITPLEELFHHLEKKVAEGKIISYGVSNFSDLPLTLPPNLVSFSMEHSLCNRTHEATINLLKSKMGLHFFSWGSLAQGFLSGVYDKQTKFAKNDRRSRHIYNNFHGQTFIRNLKIIECMKEISLDIGRSLPQIAIRWLLDNLAGDTTVLLGIKRPSNILEAIGAFDWHLNEYHMRQLNIISSENI